LLPWIDAVVGQPQHVGHRRVIDVGNVIGVLLGDREDADRSGLVAIALEDRGRADLVAVAEHGQGARREIDRHDQRSWLALAFVPEELAELDRFVDFQDRLDHKGIVGRRLRSGGVSGRLWCRGGGFGRRGFGSLVLVRENTCAASWPTWNASIEASDMATKPAGTRIQRLRSRFIGPSSVTGAGLSSPSVANRASMLRAALRTA
jgi:hypothetical protein